MKIAAAILLLALLSSGCANTGSNVGAMYDGYIKQDDEINSMTITGITGITFVDGGGTFIINNTKPLKSVLSQPASVIEKVVDKAATLGGLYIGGEVLKHSIQQPRTVEPSVVRPEVFFVPEAGMAP